MCSFIRSNSRQPQRLLASAIGLAVVSLATPALANDLVHIDTLKVEDEASRYHTEQSASSKYTAPLIDTPQTITVVPAEVIHEQQALSLRQVLSNVSGITFAAGEGGGSGDSINVRGFSANANLQVDGLRDSTQTNRTDTFNIESVEVTKGPNSVFGGAGTTGGSINQVSKEPRAREFTEIGTSVGTDNYHRVTLDTNHKLTDVGTNSAFRLNMMVHENDVPGRDVIDRQRWGIAPSLALGINDDTRLTLSYFHQVDDLLPDYGVPARDGKRVAGVNREAYFGWQNLDKDDIKTNAITIKFEHQFNDALRLQNSTRYTNVDRNTINTASHINISGLAPGFYKPAGPQASGRNIKTDMLMNQTNLQAEFNTFGFTHSVATGIEISREHFDLLAYNHGLATALYPAAGYELSNPPGYWNGPITKTYTTGTHTQMDTKAFYFADTIALSPQWDLNLGLRYDYLEGQYDSTALTTHVRTRLESTDSELSGRTGLVYKPAENGRIYVAYGTSFNPSAENLTSSGAGLSATTVHLAPEKNTTLELGTKWELFGGRLGLESALFRVEKTDARETMLDGSTQLAGEQRVQGLELGITGKLTDQWNLYANYTFLDSETLKAANTDAGKARIGQALANTPPRSLNLWSTYQLPAGWNLGYGARYTSERNVASSGTAKLEAYWLHNAMVGYKINEHLNMQLNLNNLFDKTYVAQVRTTAGTDTRSSAIEYGDGRSAILSATYAF
ncbi:MAG: TonB-dependent receptor [Pseudomonas sp.]